MVPFLDRLAVGLGVMSVLGASACASERDALYTQLPTPDDARMVDGDPHLVDDHGDVHVRAANKLDPTVDVHGKTGDDSADVNHATEKLRDR
jgi:hypothetical protein